ncbi:hypothetical protein CEXT_616751 [Caerostris extrusa]|uniref:Uncharacterized protein n=1 Tax=Caerostris extrusa TaxID=172846 RepID=A0AAV4MLI8_CAEEX|nr:hypothetical protein CEXT_616751 [Caerostris extrusa]
MVAAIDLEGRKLLHLFQDARCPGVSYSYRLEQCVKQLQGVALRPNLPYRMATKIIFPQSYFSSGNLDLAHWMKGVSVFLGYVCQLVTLEVCLDIGVI